MNSLRQSVRLNLNRINRLDLQEQELMELSDDDFSDEESFQFAPRIDHFISQCSQIGYDEDRTFERMIRFDMKQFAELYSIVEFDMQPGRGRSPQLVPMDQFYGTLNFCRSAPDYFDLGRDLGVKESTVKNLVWNVIEKCTPNELMPVWSMTESRSQGFTYHYFPESLLSGDCRVQMRLRPTYDQKAYYSGKHKFHCLKSFSCHYPNGTCPLLSDDFPGATYDGTLGLKYVPQVKELLAKTAFEVRGEDSGENSENFPIKPCGLCWPILHF